MRRAAVPVETLLLYLIAGMLGTAGALLFCVAEAVGMDLRAERCIVGAGMLAVSAGVVLLARNGGDPPLGPVVFSCVPMTLFAFLWI
jgi:hypothetical protein